ncbi:hypothetical protein [Actinoplanes sp. NPDC049681]|uniref:hypothetical protein n=1 Tax=Actinoplanes sp. NPDC049681 TaxID=3363905 RepID=UPI0037916580
MNVVADMLLTPAPAVIWATLMVLTLPALLLLGSPAGMRHPRQAARELVTAVRGHREHLRAERSRQAAEAARAQRYAEEVRVAADRAAATAERWQEVWQRSTEEVDAAWQAWLDADARLRRAVAAAAWGSPAPVPTCDEYAARERFLHRAVVAAADRGDLPAVAVADALAGRNGWDPRLHPVDQELVIARAAVAWLRQRCQRAVVAERAAWHDAELARRTRDSLLREAVAWWEGGSETPARSGRRSAIVAAA